MELLDTLFATALTAAGWVLVALLVMLAIDLTTNRVTRFIGNKPWRAWVFVLLWPLLAAYVFLPRYRVRQGARQLIKPTPFVKA
ncbi:MAG: hypothetical protein ACOY5W_09025 [Pseudomonadota bacterium]